MKLHGESIEVLGKIPSILDLVLSRLELRTQEVTQPKLLADVRLPQATRCIPGVAVSVPGR